MDIDSATSALLEKLRLESRRAQLLDKGGGVFDSPIMYAQSPPSNNEQQQPEWSQLNGHQRHEAIVQQHARAQQQQQQQSGTNNNNIASAIEATKMEQYLRLEVESLHDRIRQLESSLQYERERHAQTRELLRIALKPPPEESAAIARQEEERNNNGGRRRSSSSASPGRHRGGDRGRSAAEDPNLIAAAMYGLDGSRNSPVRDPNRDSEAAAAAAASYHRYEVYGPVTPSRVAQMMYSQAHELDHSQAASRQVLQQAQGTLAQFHQQHQGQGATEGSALLAAHQQGMRQQQQQQQHGMDNNNNNNNNGGGMMTPNSTGGGGLRSRSPGATSRASTPSRAARPFGVGERRFHPLATIGITSTYATSGGLLLRADDVRNTLGSSSSSASKRGTPSRRSPAGTTLRSPAQVYGSWA